MKQTFLTELGPLFPRLKPGFVGQGNVLWAQQETTSEDTSFNTGKLRSLQSVNRFFLSLFCYCKNIKIDVLSPELHSGSPTLSLPRDNSLCPFLQQASCKKGLM